jgi:hypothetical protein
VGLLELAGEAGRCQQVGGCSQPCAFVIVISTARQRLQAIVAAALRTSIMREQPPTALPSARMWL